MRWMFEDGFIRLATVRGAPIKLHWSFFLTALFFGGLTPGGWLGYFLLIAVHELGHAALVWWCGHRVIEMQVHGLGGLCRYDGFTTEYESALISWGGVWAQGLLYLAASLTLALAPPTQSDFAMVLLGTLVVVNVHILVFNLVPVPGFDGASAWRLFPLLWGHAKYEAKRGRPSRPSARAPRPALRLVVTDPTPDDPPPRAPVDPTAERAKDELFEKILRDLNRAPQHVNDEDP